MSFVGISIAESSDTAKLRGRAKDAFLAVGDGLQAVENRIRSKLVSEAPPLSQIADYLLSLGGKRIRPILVLLTAKLCRATSQSEQLIDAAAGIELIHMATLLHDDIIDESPRRRHRESAFVKFGFIPSLLTGDFLWVRAFGLCAHLGDFVVSATERACVELTEGEVLEGTLSADRDYPLSEYLNIVEKKTASLFSLSTAVGAYFGGATGDDLERLTAFGSYSGIAFQMIDDVLDVVADETLLGKPSGTDLKQRTPSLVNILWLASGDPQAVEFFSRESISTAEAEAAVLHLRKSPVLDEAREVAKSYCELARNELFTLESEKIDVDSQQQLAALLGYTLERCL